LKKNSVHVKDINTQEVTPVINSYKIFETTEHKFSFQYKKEQMPNLSSFDMIEKHSQDLKQCANITCNQSVQHASILPPSSSSFEQNCNSYDSDDMKISISDGNIIDYTKAQTKADKTHEFNQFKPSCNVSEVDAAIIITQDNKFESKKFIDTNHNRLVLPQILPDDNEREQELVCAVSPPDSPLPSDSSTTSQPKPPRVPLKQKHIVHFSGPPSIPSLPKNMINLVFPPPPPPPPRSQKRLRKEKSMRGNVSTFKFKLPEESDKKTNLVVNTDLEENLLSPFSKSDDESSVTFNSNSIESAMKAQKSINEKEEIAASIPLSTANFVELESTRDNNKMSIFSANMKSFLSPKSWKIFNVDVDLSSKLQNLSVALSPDASCAMTQQSNFNDFAMSDADYRSHVDNFTFSKKSSEKYNDNKGGKFEVMENDVQWEVSLVEEVGQSEIEVIMHESKSQNGQSNIKNISSSEVTSNFNESLDTNSDRDRRAEKCEVMYISGSDSDDSGEPDEPVNWDLMKKNYDGLWKTDITSPPFILDHKKMEDTEKIPTSQMKGNSSFLEASHKNEFAQNLHPQSDMDCSNISAHLNEFEYNLHLHSDVNEIDKNITDSINSNEQHMCAESVACNTELLSIDSSDSISIDPLMMSTATKAIDTVLNKSTTLNSQARKDTTLKVESLSNSLEVDFEIKKSGSDSYDMLSAGGSACSDGDSVDSATLAALNALIDKMQFKGSILDNNGGKNNEAIKVDLGMEDFP